MSGCLTTEGEACKFPFTYQGTEYFECTSIANNGVPWCGTASGGWGNCQASCTGDENDIENSMTIINVCQVA